MGMSAGGNRPLGIALATMWTTTLFVGVCSSVVLTNGYGPLVSNGDPTMQLLIHNDDSAYSWSYAWSSTDPTDVMVPGSNRIEDYFQEMAHRGELLPPHMPLRFTGYEPVYNRGWAGAGRRWNGRFPVCENGLRQSPVNIDTSRLQVVHERHSPLRFEGYWNSPDRITIKNEGDTIKLEFEWPEGMQPTISGGPLRGEYQFMQLHFHWGSRNSIGSEHRLDNISLPMELHAVHFKKEYGSAMNAMNKPDGLVVIGNLLTVSDYANIGLASLVSDLYRVSNTEEENVSAEMSNLIYLGEIVPPFSNCYITYLGSLTTPPCSEIVTWIISTRIQKISHAQLDAFRSVYTTAGLMQNNFRETQPLNGRILKYVE